jgi:hypothetical protein
MLRRRVVTAMLYLVQPVARLSGRLGYQFWSRHWWGEAKLRPLWPHTTATWTERWQGPATRLSAIEEALRDEGAPVRRGGDFDRWDLQVRWGSLGAARLLLGVEDHSQGHQLVRVRVWPRWPLRGPLLTLVFGALALGAARANAWTAAVVLGGVATFIGLRTMVDVTAALNVTGRALKRLGLAPP